MEDAQLESDRLPAPPATTVNWFAHPSTPPRQSATEYVSPLKDHWSQWNTTIPKLPNIERNDKKRQSYPMTGRDNVNFARLLTLDYQREWLQKRGEKLEKQKKSARVRS